MFIQNGNLSNLNSLKPNHISSVKSVKDGDKTFVKAMIMKSFGQEITRPAVAMLQKNLPVKGHCACPIGKCGICCHIIALLMFL